MIQQDAKRQQHGHGREQLADADRPEPQAVRSQTLNDHASCAVPGEVCKERLAVKLALLRQEVQHDKAGQVPDGLIEERRVEILQLAVFDQTHAQEAGRHAAVGLSVEEVAPAADGLPEQQTDAGQVQKGQDLELPHAGIDQHAEHRADDAAVDGKAAAADVEEAVPRDAGAEELVPLEDDIVQARADDGGRQADEHEIENVVLRDAELLGPAQAVRHGEQNADGNDDAVEFDLEVCSRDAEAVGRINALNAEPGEADGTG